MADHPPLILASTSPYRRELLARLGLEFDTRAPDIDETVQPDEKPDNLVIRLAESKASVVASSYSKGLVIGSDQVAVLDGKILGKPGDHETAVRQLSASSGRKIVFYTGLCVLNVETGKKQIAMVPFTVVFRELDKEIIESYLRKEQPYNCAGSFKSEGLGICLFKRLEGDDPTALIGLPLIRLVSMLQAEGLKLP